MIIKETEKIKKIDDLKSLLFLALKINIEIIKMFINEKIDLNEKNIYGDNYLKNAVEINQNVEVIKLLINEKTDINEKNNFAECALRNIQNENFINLINRALI